MRVLEGTCGKKRFRSFLGHLTAFPAVNISSFTTKRTLASIQIPHHKSHRTAKISLKILIPSKKKKWEKIHARPHVSWNQQFMKSILVRICFEIKFSVNGNSIPFQLFYIICHFLDPYSGCFLLTTQRSSRPLE